MPALARLAPRQLVWPTTASTTVSLAQTDATRFVPQATASASADASSGSGSDVSVWKYAIVVILCVFALGALFRLGFLYRLRRQRALHTAQLLSRPRPAPRPSSYPRRADSQHSWNGSTYSVDLDPAADPPPPDYDEIQRPTLPATAPTTLQSTPPPPPPPPAAPPKGLFARWTSSLRGGSGGPRDSSLPMQDLASPRPSASTTSARTSAPPPQRSADPATLAEVAHLRRALRDAGLLGISATSGLSSSTSAHGRVPRSFADLVPRQRAALHGASPAVLVAAAAALAAAGTHEGEEEEADPEARRADRARRRAERRIRRRREREAQREREEGLGLPTYSRDVPVGEETLQRAEGCKTDDGSENEDEDEDDLADDDRSGNMRGEEVVGVLPILSQSAHHPPHASTSAPATDASAPPAVAADNGYNDSRGAGSVPGPAGEPPTSTRSAS